MMPHAPQRRAPAVALACAVLVGFGCGRTELDGLTLSPGPPEAQAGAAQAAPSPTLDPSLSPSEPQLPPIASTVDCEPSPETCNGRDDDCNGLVDDVAPEPCAGGGARYCIAGHMSDCPRRCERCLPGSERICQLSYCTYWGVQTCSADGKSFSFCREQRVPRECAKVAERFQNSRELEQCCLDNGYCCVDTHDLNGNGDRAEMLGRCEAVECSP
jgi:hypothetical protein